MQKKWEYRETIESNFEKRRQNVQSRNKTMFARRIAKAKENFVLRPHQQSQHKFESCESRLQSVCAMRLILDDSQPCDSCWEKDGYRVRSSWTRNDLLASILWESTVALNASRELFFWWNVTVSQAVRLKVARKQFGFFIEFFFSLKTGVECLAINGLADFTVCVITALLFSAAKVEWENLNF